jgi:hypothetical protein
MARILLVVSDLHCGSEVGLMPPDTTVRTGNKISFGGNVHQEWLWACWTDLQAQFARICGKDKYALLLNGDLTEGIHHKSIESLTQSIEDHANMAIEAVGGLAAKAHKTFVTLGTEVHTGLIEHYIAKKIGAEGKGAKAKWLFRMAGCLVDATHHIGVTSRAYLEATSLSITMGNARLNSMRCGQEPARIYLRGHRHTGGWFSDGQGMIGVTGGWQFLTRYGRKVVPDAIPRPSAMVLDWRRKRDGELPEVTEIVFTPDQDEITTV